MDKLATDRHGIDLEDDEPEVIFESSTKSKSKKSRRTKLGQNKNSANLSSNPVPINDSDGRGAEGFSSSYAIPKLNEMQNNDKIHQDEPDQTIYLSDSDDEMKETEQSLTTESSDVEMQPENRDVMNHSGIKKRVVYSPQENNVISMEEECVPQTRQTSMTDEEIEDVTPPEILRAARLRQAEEVKKSGNLYFAMKDYHKALEMYTKAIEYMPEAAFYGNRSACYMMLKKYKLAQEDARTSIQMDPSFTNGYLRLLRATLALGDTVGTETLIASLKASNTFTGNFEDEEGRLATLKTLRKEINIFLERKDYRTVLYHCDRGLAIAYGDMELKMLKADALLKLNRVTEAQELCMDVLQQDSRCVDAYYIRSICLYLADNLDKGIQFLKQALQLAPDSTLILNLFRKLKKLKEIREEASSLFSKGRYTEARAKFRECIESVKAFEYPNSMIESKMSLNLSLIAVKLRELDEGLMLVNRAVDLNPSYLKALLHRAQIHKTKEMFSEAIADYEAAQKLEPSNASYRKYIQELKLAAKKAQRKDYYKILGVDKNASQDEVKKAYKKRALIHHPDRHSSASEAVQKEQEKQFKELGQAYEILSDPKKRNHYDNGHDLMDSSEHGFSHAEFDPSNLFNVFFGGGGMGYARANSGFQQQHHRPSNFHPY